jgi:ribosome recycling factor
MEEVKLYLDDANETMQKAVQHVNIEFSRIRAGKANVGILDGIRVDYYGTQTPLSQMAALSTPDGRTITVKPFEKSMLMDVERAVRDSDIGINPQNDGEMIRLSIPPLTEERRKGLVKQAKHEAEEGKISIRNIRKSTNEDLRKLLKDGISEDVIKDAETKVQKLTDTYIAKIDELMVQKENEIMTV